MSRTVPGEVPLFLEDAGEGPALLLMHGFGGSARNFRVQARALHDRFRVLLFDARGHARSGAPRAPEAYAPERFVADVGRVLDFARVERAAVGGLSMGAGLALRFALAQPERVAGLCLAAFPPAGGEGPHAAWARAFADAIERDGVEAAGELFAWGPRSGFDSNTARWVRAGFLEHAPHALVHILRRLLAVQPSVDALAPRLAALSGCPALLLVGGSDRLSRGPTEALARALPDAELRVVEGAGHAVNLAAPAVVNATLRKFLSALAFA